MAIEFLLAGTALVAVYWVFARVPRTRVSAGSLHMVRYHLLLRYVQTIWWTATSGFLIATMGGSLGWFRLIGLGISVLLGLTIGYLWACYHVKLVVLHLGLGEEHGESNIQEPRTIPRLPAWKVLLILAGAQAMGALAGHVTIMYR